MYNLFATINGFTTVSTHLDSLAQLPTHLNALSVLPTHLAEDAPSGIHLLLPEFPEVFWSAVVVLLLAIPICKFVVPRFSSVLDERVKQTVGKLENAEQTKQKADATLEKYNSKMRELTTEASTIRESARADGVKIIETSKQQAQDQATHIIDVAKKTIEAERLQTAVSLQKDIGNMATTLAEKLVSTALIDKKVQEQVIDKFIDDIDASDLGKK